MTLTRNAKAKLIRHFGEIFVEEPHRLKLYSQDFNSMITKELRKDKIIPDGILGVRTEEELMKLYEVATEENIPLIIRGSSSGDVGGAVPSENGIVVDLKHLNTSPIVEPIEQKMITGASIDFKDIQSVAILNGFSLCCYPSNLYSATPGGWVAQGGYGLGSLRYGSALDQIIELEVILPNGEKKIFAEKDDFKLFFGSHGTLGVITNITLKLKFDTPLNHHGCTYDNYKGLANALEYMSEKLTPYSLWFINPKLAEDLVSRFNLYLPNRITLIASEEISYDEAEVTFRTNFNKNVRESDGQILDDSYLKEIGHIRLNTVSILKKYGCFAFAKTILPLTDMAEYLNKITNVFKGELRVEGNMISNVKVQLLLTIPFVKGTPEKEQIKTYKELQKWVEKAEKYNGSPSSTGICFKNSYVHIFGKEQEQEYRAYKKQIDPNNISNPGKVLK